MHEQGKSLSNFSQAIHTHSQCYRPDNEWQLPLLFNQSPMPNILARGQGLSYGDCCLFDNGKVIDCSRLNHLLSFDVTNGLLYCQGGVSFKDLFSVHDDFIPPVIPGTVHATLAGGLANDIHGKNNHRAGSLGQHIKWIELQVGNRVLRCSPDRHADLFTATIGGLGLTGIIRRLALTLQKKSRFVEVQTEQHQTLDTLLLQMQQKGLEYDYQVAWIDLLNKPRALLSLANHCQASATKPAQNPFSIPPLPFRLITKWGMQQFNRLYFNQATTRSKIQTLSQFNNPLDAIAHWNRLYGKKGLLQFQAVFDSEKALDRIQQLLAIINSHKATPTLTVLKYFTQTSRGFLSFVKPGFTIAIDFIHNPSAKTAIEHMNQYITDSGGRVYLAKDFLLTAEQFKMQYPDHDRFKHVLKDYECPMQSDLGKRLGLINP